MPYCITNAGVIQPCFPDFGTARSEILQLREQGHKPRLYYSTSFESLGCEVDDHGMRIQDYTYISWSNFTSLLSHFDSPWSVIDDELSNDIHRVVDIYSTICGRTHHLADMVYVHGENEPSNPRVDTRLLRVSQGLMDPNDL